MKIKNIFYIISFVLLSSCNYLDVEPTGKRGYGSPEQFYAEICRQPAFRIEIPRRSRGNEMVPDPAEYEEIHTLPLEYLFSL